MKFLKELYNAESEWPFIAFMAAVTAGWVVIVAVLIVAGVVPYPFSH